MKKGANVAEFTDLLFCAEEIGYDWNDAHDILDRDGIRPEYEVKSLEYWLDNKDEPCGIYPDNWSDDTKKILKAFFEQEQVTEFTLVA